MSALVSYADILDDLFSQTTDSRRREAVLDARNGNFDEAISKMKKVLAETKNAPDVLCDYVVILKRAGIYDEALKAYDMIPKDYKIPDAVQVEMAVVYYKSGKFAEAADLFVKYLKKDEKDEALVGIMVDAYASSGNSDKAIRYLNARAIGATQVPAWIQKLQIRAKHGKAVEEARAGKHQEALDILSGLLKETGDDQAIMSDYILVLSWAGRKDEAKRLYEDYFKDRKAPEYLTREIASIPAVKVEVPEKKAETPPSPENIESPKPITAEPSSKEAVSSKILPEEQPQSELDKYISSGKISEALEEIVRQISKDGGRKGNFEKSLNEIHKRAVQLARDGSYEASLAVLDKIIGLKYDTPAVAADKIVVLVWAGRYDEAIESYRSYKLANKPPAYLLETVGTAFRRKGEYEEALGCYNESISSGSTNPEVIKGKVFSLIGVGKSAEAHDFILKEISSRQEVPEWLQILKGEALLAEGKYDEAESFFRNYLAGNPGSETAKRMLVGILIQKRSDIGEAERITDDLISSEPKNTDYMFLKVTILQIQGKSLEAYAYNEKILAIDGMYQPSVNARYHILMDMKATILANDMLIERNDRISIMVKRRMLGDLAAEQLAWKDPARAQELLRKNLEYYNEHLANVPSEKAEAEVFKTRMDFDMMMSLFQKKDMADVIKLYEEIERRGVKIPYWIKLTAASAYLYCRNPDKALSLYYDVQEEMKAVGKDRYSDNYDLLIGIYSTLIELERQRAAYEIIERLEKEVPSFARPTGVLVQNPDWMDVSTEKGWWYIYNDQLSYAEDYLSALLQECPYNTNVRTALAYVHYYRGWPRLALEDFQISANLDPNDRVAQIGLAYSLNENDEWEDARTLAAELAKRYPKDLDVKKLLRTFELQEKRTFTVDANYSNDGNFVDGAGITMKLEQPIYPDRNVYTEALWLQTKDPDKTRNIYRGAIGFDWRLNRDLYIFGEASMDYHAENPGFMAGLRWKPTDHLTLTGFYNSYTLNMPPKALLYKKKGQEANFSAEYRFNEDLIVSGGFSNVWVSDGNINQTYSWKIDKGIWSSAYWKFRASVEGSTTTNTKTDTDYYSPRYYTSLYFVPMVEHLWYRSYETSIVDRLFLGIGPHWEKDYTCKAQYYARYEQEYQLTDWFGFKLGGKIGKERYGNDSPCSWGFYGSMNFKF